MLIVVVIVDVKFVAITATITTATRLTAIIVLHLKQELISSGTPRFARADLDVNVTDHDE